MSRVLMMIAVAVVLPAMPLRETGAQERATHNVFVSLIEVKGGTTSDKLSPPSANPRDLSRGYEFKGPGAADRSSPHRWEVSAYMFMPAFVTIRQGDAVIVTAFVVNGDEHDVWVNAPDGTMLVPKATWNRGREYRVRFIAERAGAYQLVCSQHAPSMTATFLALPK